MWSNTLLSTVCQSRKINGPFHMSTQFAEVASSRLTAVSLENSGLPKCPMPSALSLSCPGEDMLELLSTSQGDGSSPGTLCA